MAQQATEQPLSPPEMLRQMIQNIPEPGAGSVPYVVATTPARMFMQMAKQVLTSAVNLMDIQGQNQRGFVDPTDLLNVMPIGAEPMAFGVFGGRGVRGASRVVKDVRGNLLHEIDDSQMKITASFPKKAGETVRLDRAIDHPELFTLYPELKQVTIARTNDGYSVDNLPGGFDPPNSTRPGHITIGTAGPDDDISAIGQTLIHELQHSVQAQDILSGMSRGTGTNPNLAAQEGQNALVRLKKMLAENPAGMSPEQLTALSRLTDATLDAHQLYMREPGELEARVASTRARYSAADRAAHPSNLQEDAFGPLHLRRVKAVPSTGTGLSG